MKKQVRTLIIALIAVAVLAAGYIVVKLIMPAADDSSAKNYLVKKNTSGYFAVKVSNPTDDYTYVIGKIPQLDESYLYVYQDNGIDDGFDYSQSLMDDAFTRLCALEYTDVVVTSAEDYTQFGLDDGHAVRVTAVPQSDTTDETATQFTLLIGSYNDVSSGYYAKLADSPEVYFISTLNANTYITGSLRYRSLDIVPDFGTYYDAIKTIKFTNTSGETMEFERFESYDSDEEGVIIYTTFRMTSPFTCYVSDDIIGEDMLDVISGSSVMQAVANHPEDLSVYGLDKAARVELNTDAGTTTLLVGTGTDGGLYYMKEGIDTVFAIYGSAGYVGYEPMKFRSSLVWLHDIKNAETVRLDLPTGTYSMRVDDTINTDDSTGTFVADLDGSVLTEDNGRRLYTSVIGITYDDLTVGKPIEDTPSYRFKITYKSGFTESVSFYKVTSRQYAVCFNDEAPNEENFCVNVTSLRKVSENIATILAGGTIPRY